LAVTESSTLIMPYTPSKALSTSAAAARSTL
jgi:hypothetical protein